MKRAEACRVCLCTENNACPGGCAWVPGSRLPIGRICTTCDARAQAVRLTYKPKSSLVELFKSRSFDRKAATTGMRNVRALVNRGLIMGLYDESIRRTVYWLTTLGREVARRAA